MNLKSRQRGAVGRILLILVVVLMEVVSVLLAVSVVELPLKKSP